MAKQQVEVDKEYRRRQKELGMAKICVMFPIAFKPRLMKFVEKNKAEWILLRENEE